jgi:hypothetical protein
MAAVAWSRRGARSNGTENAVRSKDSISGKRSSRVDDPKPSFPVGSVSLAALISCRCPTDGAIWERAIRLSETRRRLGRHIYMSLSPSKPAGALRRAFYCARALMSLGRGSARDVIAGPLAPRLGARLGGTLGMRGCALSARIGATGVKRAAIGRSSFSNSIRARRTSDICFGRFSHASV